MKKLLVLLFLWTSCFQPDARMFLNQSGNARVFKDFPIRWKFGCDFPPELEEPVRNAIDYWQKFTKKRLLEEERDCTLSDIFLYTSSGGLAFVVEPKHSPFEWHDDGWVELWARAPMSTLNDEPFAGLIVFYKKWHDLNNGSVQESIARHELGHFFGFQHSDRVDCLMFRTMSEQDESKEMCLPEIKLFKEYY
jgi:hypothetical protein